MSVEITDEMVEAAAQAAWDAVPSDWKDEYGLWQPMPSWAMAGDTDHIPARERMRAALAVVGPMIQEATARRIATNLHTKATERAQMDDMAGSARFTEAARVATDVAKEAS